MRTMRVTNSMVVNNLLSNLGGNATRLAKYQNQVSTGKKISELRKEKNMTQKELADKINKGYPFLCQVETEIINDHIYTFSVPERYSARATALSFPLAMIVDFSKSFRGYTACASKRA